MVILARAHHAAAWAFHAGGPRGTLGAATASQHACSLLDRMSRRASVGSVAMAFASGQARSDHAGRRVKPVTRPPAVRARHKRELQATGSGPGAASDPGPGAANGSSSSSSTVSASHTPLVGDKSGTIPEASTPGYSGEIFCNRNLNMAKVAAVGFDMDYTLATYKAQPFELLAYEGARKRLVEMGYPQELLRMSAYDPSYFCRGLVVDKKRGNILKMDRHKYVKIAYHGFQELSKEERDLLYDPAVTTWSTFREPDYAVLDTLFSLPDAYLFCELIELKKKYPEQISKSFLEMYRDVRRCVDISHRDGYIKLKVAEEPSKYIIYDPKLITMLQRIRKAGRRVFLVTNSLYDYTDVVMTYLVTGGDPRMSHVNWHDFFDLIIVGACKPGFLTDPNLSLYRVNPQDGTLSNTEGPVVESPEEYLRVGKIFQGGNWQHLHNLLQVKSGAQLVYVGDHMYSDILRSKRELGWRTILVIPELEHEIDVMVRERARQTMISRLTRLRDDLDGWVDRLETNKLDIESEHPEGSKAIQEIEAELQRVRMELSACKQRLVEVTKEYHELFHPIWGQLFKTGYQNSRFAEQVENYACLYTSKVTNLASMSPDHNYRCMSDMMPHDRLEDNPIRRLLRSKMGSDGDRTKP
ncbi:Cytosolic purine 5'-nucleotidase [Porphyridium purpureum]|uniref:Cytosolic purine 5'-nucleotidase n=1 Tax=Porphyridium purpureum TaxID=35688 RepID=A0A5J4YLT0_PORPP|nr:Cytosolic purine 5'-nucleotidase [Porphyridium purpureum]|eukprot:POR6521..scf295_9